MTTFDLSIKCIHLALYGVSFSLRPERKVPTSEVRLPPITADNERVAPKEGDEIEVSIHTIVGQWF
jgi:hypothetical protein